MDAKLNHSDLSALMAKEACMSLAKAEFLTKAIFDIIIEGLEQDGIVKINGLGTFKLTDVASRSSVNVNTGEKFEIKGHKKLVFTPADSLKDSVNQPFAMFEPVEVDETYSDEADDENGEYVADDENSVDTGEIAVADETETAIKEHEVAEDDFAETTEEQFKESVEQPVVLDSNPVDELDVPTEPQTVVQSPRPEPVMVHVPKKEKKQFAVPEKKNKKNHMWLYVVFAVLFVLSAMAVLFTLYITPAKTDDVRVDSVTRFEYKTDDATGATVVEETTTKTVHTTDAVIGVTEVEESVAKTEYKPDALTGATVDATSSATPLDKELDVKEESLDVLVQEIVEPAEYKFVITEELAALDLKNITVADTTLYNMSDVLAEHKVVAHETLTRIALKYYGDKKLWPYIVKYNSLARPDDLCKGMNILIPKLQPKD